MGERVQSIHSQEDVQCHTDVPIMIQSFSQTHHTVIEQRTVNTVIKTAQWSFSQTHHTVIEQ